MHLHDEQHSTQVNMSILKLQLVQKRIEIVYAGSLSPVYVVKPFWEDVSRITDELPNLV